MGLFGNRNASNIVAQQDAAQQQANSENNIAVIVAAVVKELLPSIQQQSTQHVQQEPPAEQEDDLADMDTVERDRIERIAGRIADAKMAPYANIYNASVPSIVRDSVVAKLTPGQKMIYDKYRNEVDAGIDRACSLNPALRGVAEIHQRAIALVIGEHSDEIESLALTHATQEDLARYQPTVFAAPSAGANGSAAQQAPQATAEEREWLSFNETRTRHQWNIEDMRYWKNIKGATMSEMIANHKAAQQAQQQQGGTQ